MPKGNLMVIYVNNDLHKKIKLYCIKHNIKSIQGFIEPLLEAAITKPPAKERLERAAEDITPEEKELIDKEMEDLKNEGGGVSAKGPVPIGQIKVIS